MNNKMANLIELLTILKARRTPITKQNLSLELGVVERSVDRYINEWKYEYYAPIKKNDLGFYLDESEEVFQLPGVWLTNSELMGLASITKALDDMGLSTDDNPDIHELKKTVDKLLLEREISPDTFYESIKLLPSHKQSHSNLLFSRISDAIINKQRIKLAYTDYRNQSTQREISPLQLVNYRESWFVDGYCHLRKALRQFKLCRIDNAKLIMKQAKKITEKEHKAHFVSAYGIFSGKATGTAKLRFFDDAAIEVSQQQWHPKQNSEWEGAEYLLSFPFHKDEELIRDILKYANNVEVIAPSKLRKKVARIAGNMVDVYAKNYR